MSPNDRNTIKELKKLNANRPMGVKSVTIRPKLQGVKPLTEKQTDTLNPAEKPAYTAPNAEVITPAEPVQEIIIEEHPARAKIDLPKPAAAASAASVPTANKKRQSGLIGLMLTALISSNTHIMLVGLPALILAGIYYTNAWALSIIFAIVTIPTMLIMYTVRPYLPSWLRAPLAAVISCTLYGLAAIVISPIQKLTNELLMYAPLIAVGGSALSGIRGVADKQATPLKRLILVFIYALLASISFSVMTFIVSAIREYINFGTILGMYVGFTYSVPVAAYPFAGLILAGLLLAGIRKLRFLR